MLPGPVGSDERNFYRSTGSEPVAETSDSLLFAAGRISHDLLWTNVEPSRALDLISDVSAQTRAMRLRSAELIRESNRKLRLSNLALESAEEQAQYANALALAAVKRAQEAEDQVRLLTKMLDEAEIRADNAEWAARKSLEWLKRLYRHLSIELKP